MASVNAEPLPTVVGRVTPPVARRPAELLARILHEMHACAAAGERPDTDVYFRRYPEVLAHPEIARSLVIEEAMLRQRHGEPGAADEIIARYPQWQEELRRALQETKTAAVTPPPLFAHDGAFVGFRLLSPLGRGAEGQVFLALQPELANRPVVLKITNAAGHEHLSLARLQHTHIVPLYGVYEDHRSGRRALCMPFFGNATLQHLLDALTEIPYARRTGADLVAALDLLLSRIDVALPRHGAGRTFLAGASYVQAVAWIGLGLAEALRYAHDRHLIHLDLKPSNILLSADGQPMLLDFHIAQEPIRPEQPPPPWVGGTPAFMSPEQEQVIGAVEERRPIVQGIDGRSDLYSLGLVLYTALAGEVSRSSDLPPLARRNPQVSPGLSAIIARCLAPCPEHRYPDAGALAEDLRRHLNDLPLRGVSNRSLRERWQKWRRRRPYALSLTLLLVTLLGTAAAAALLVSRSTGERHRRAQQALFVGQQEMRQRRHAEAIRALEQGLTLCSGLVHDPPLAQGLAEHLRLARRAHKAQELHGLVDSLRGLYLIEHLPPRLVYVLEVGCRQAWAERGRVLDAAVPLEAETEKTIRTDLIDLAVCWADLQVRLARPEERPARRRAALALLADAEAQLGRHFSLLLERGNHAEALGEHTLARAAEAAAAEIGVRSAWDHYALGRSYLRAGAVEKGLRELEQSLALEPHSFWTNFSLGHCHARLGRHAEAEAAFSVCIGHAPHVAEPYVERARAAAARQRWQQARRDCDHALKLRPNLPAALLQRGTVLLAMRELDAAEADLMQALRQGTDKVQTENLLAQIHQARLSTEY